MRHQRTSRTTAQKQTYHNRQTRRTARHNARPVAAYRSRGIKGSSHRACFDAPEDWHEPCGRAEMKFRVQPPGEGYTHPVTVDDVRERLAQLPAKFARNVEVVQFSRMTRKRRLFPCYGMQWGPNVYLYPIEESLVEAYVRPPLPEQLIEAKMYGGRWEQHGKLWTLTWTPETIRDFYLNNVLIHEVGHVNDARNSNFQDRERYADWFAIEYGYRASRKKRAS